MPDPLDFRPALDASPDNGTHRLVLADALFERADPRANILWAAHAIMRRVRGVTFPDRCEAFWTESPGWGAAARRLETLAQEPRNTEAFRERYARLVRGDVPLDVEDLEATARLQYDLQRRLLSSLHLLDGNGGITAIDGRHYPLPGFEDILARLHAPGIGTKLTQGFDTLLLVPFGLPLERFLTAWREGLRRSVAALGGRHRQLRSTELIAHVGRPPIVYGPLRFAADHGGRTKEQLLAGDGRGWDVLLVEGALQNLPGEGEGQTVGGRLQLECGRRPAEYLRALQGRGEVGLTPEAYVIHFLDGLERRNQVLDWQSASHLLGAYLPASHRIPAAYFNPGLGRAILSNVDPADDFTLDGARVAVRVC